MFIIKKRFHYSAAHRLCSDAMSEAENFAAFGKCASPNYHGHNYVLDVAVTGEMNPLTGMVVNYDELKRIVNDEIIEALDHKNLNMDVDFLRGEITTSENLARLIWERLAPRIKGARLYEITLGESNDNIATYRGEV